jgi:hypothetical protein
MKQIFLLALFFSNLIVFSKNSIFSLICTKKFLPSNNYAVHDTSKNDTSKKKMYLSFTNLRPSYHFFIGEDAKLLSTTIKGLGSFSEWNLVVGNPFVIGKQKTKLLCLPRLGFLWKKFRFSQPLFFYSDTTKTFFALDTSSVKNFGKGFFSYGKTKLVVPTFRLNPEIGISIDVGEKAIGITTGPVIDILLGAKFKQKYKIEDCKKKNVFKGNDLFNINPIQYGMSLAIMTPWVDVYGTYMFSNFFKNGKGPKVKALEIGFIFSFLKIF